MALAKICEGRLEKITETGIRLFEDLPRLSKMPNTVFAGTYTTFVIATKKGTQTKTYEGTLLPDSLDSIIEIYEPQEQRHGRGPFSILEDEDPKKVTKRIQVYDKTLDRWYR